MKALAAIVACGSHQRREQAISSWLAFISRWPANLEDPPYNLKGERTGVVPTFLGHLTAANTPAQCLVFSGNRPQRTENEHGKSETAIVAKHSRLGLRGKQFDNQMQGKYGCLCLPGSLPGIQVARHGHALSELNSHLVSGKSETINRNETT